MIIAKCVSGQWKESVSHLKGTTRYQWSRVTKSSRTTITATNPAVEEIECIRRCTVFANDPEKSRERRETMEIFALADIRQAMGVGSVPMLSELPGLIHTMRTTLERIALEGPDPWREIAAAAVPPPAVTVR